MDYLASAHSQLFNVARCLVHDVMHVMPRVEVI